MTTRIHERETPGSGAGGARAPTPRRVFGCVGPVALWFAWLAIPATADVVAVRVRDDGRVDLKAQAAPLAAVLERLASRTEMTLVYQGRPPRKVVSLEVFAANQARAVLDVLEGAGADYAVTTNEAGTRILRLVVTENERTAGNAVEPRSGDGPETESAEPEPAEPSDTEPSDTGLDHARSSGDETEMAASVGQGEFSPLDGDFLPGRRATGQPTEWGMPAFTLPEPPVAPPRPTPTTPPNAAPEPSS